MWFREAHGRRVVTTDTAETVGRVDAYVVDPASRSVVALRLGSVNGDRAYLSWSALVAFGPDAVTIGSADRLRKPEGQGEERAASKDLQLVGKLVLTASGTALGRVRDAEFDGGSGRITSVELDDAGTISGERILGVGSYALVVEDVPAAAGAEKERNGDRSGSR